MATMISYMALVFSAIPIHVPASTIFGMSMLLDILTQFTVEKIGLHLRNVKDATISIERIEDFLLTCSISNEIDVPNLIFNDNCSCKISNAENEKKCNFHKSELSHKRQKPFHNNIAAPVVLTKLSASWTEDQPCVLHQISLTVTANQLLIVTGSVGSGKSSLLMAIQREIRIIGGAIGTRGRIAYVSQVPWIFSGTVRDNILFGRPLDETRYHTVLEVCDLKKDIKVFPNEDLCIVGQRGVRLSGGQRARVSLARAVYSDADIFLLDDPLSAVDASVGQHIFEKCICGELSNRTRILATHQVQHLPRADKIAVMREGCIVKKGSYFDIKNDEEFNEMQENIRTVNHTFEKEPMESLYQPIIADDNESKDMEEDEEDRAVGSVSWRTYWKFFRAGLPVSLIGCLVLVYIVTQGKQHLIYLIKVPINLKSF